MALAAALVVVPSAADAADPAPITASVEGTASTLETGAPLPGALVEAISRGEAVATSHADAAGHYRLAGLPARQDYRLRMSAPGHETSFWRARYQDPRVPIVIGIALGERITGIDFGIHRLDARLRGRVTDLAGRPLAGVTIAHDLNMGPAPDGPSAYAPYRTTTDADGRWELLVPPGSYRLVAERPDLVRRWWGNVLSPLDPKLLQADTTSGTVRGDVDFRLGPRPARSCWAVGGYWIAGTTDQPAPSFPPDRDDSCTGDLAPPGPLIVANRGDYLLGGQRMDMLEITSALGFPSEFGGRTPPMVRLVGGAPAPPAPTVPSAPAKSPAAAPGKLAGATRVRVRRGRFVATTSCPKRATCTGTITATAVRRTRARTSTVTVATAKVAEGTGRRTTTMRLNAAGRRLLRDSGSTLRVTLRWHSPGAAERPARAVRLVAR